jgi:hypothetical protein
MHLLGLMKQYLIGYSDSVKWNDAILLGILVLALLA